MPSYFPIGRNVQRTRLAWGNSLKYDYDINKAFVCYLGNKGQISREHSWSQLTLLQSIQSGLPKDSWCNCTHGHSWSHCRAYRVVCQRTPGAKAAVFPAPKLFARLTTGSRCLAYRCDSQKHVNIHSWKCHQKNNIDFTTGLFTHLSLIRKRPHNVPPSLPALAITSAGITDFDSTIRSTAVIDTP